MTIVKLAVILDPLLKSGDAIEPFELFCLTRCYGRQQSQQRIPRLCHPHHLSHTKTIRQNPKKMIMITILFIEER